MPGDHAEKNERFLPVPLKSLRAGTAVPADIYLRTAAGHYRLYMSRRSAVEDGAVENLRRDGCDRVYISELDTEIFYDYIQDGLQRLTDGADGMGRATVSFIYESTEKLMEHLWENPGVPEAIRRITAAVEATVTAILEDGKAFRLMLDIAGHDYYTYTHCINVSAMMIACSHLILGLDRKQLVQVGLGAMLHDIGKRCIPDTILKKPGSLSTEEFCAIMRHPQLGVEMAEEEQDIRSHARDIITWHHERYEGGGYPSGVASERLNESVRMGKIVDVYDALTTHRPYGPANTAERAARIMRHDMEGHFDGRLLQEFVTMLGLNSAA